MLWFPGRYPQKGGAGRGLTVAALSQGRGVERGAEAGESPVAVTAGRSCFVAEPDANDVGLPVVVDEPTGPPESPGTLAGIRWS